MKVFKLFSILVFALVMISCGKDDDDEIAVGEIKGLEFTEINSGAITLKWDAYEGAEEYAVFINEEELSNFVYNIAQISGLDNGDIIEVKAYSGSNLIAVSVKITYEETSDNTGNNDGGGDEGGDNGNNNEVGEIQGIETMENHGNVTILWQAFSGAKEYYVYINGQKTSTTPYTGASATLDNVAAGDIIEIKAYSDLDEKALIATGTYTYEVDNSNSFSVYDIKYFDKIEYSGELESSSDKTKYKLWKLTSSTNSNMSMVIGVSSANSNGNEIKNATYNLGQASDYANGGATITIGDSKETDGWPIKMLNQGTVKIEGSSSTGCTITISNGNNQNDFGTAFNGTAVVKF